MNKLVIIGNGFDLAHGLPTSYKDFILSCLKIAYMEYKKEKVPYSVKNLFRISCLTNNNLDRSEIIGDINSYNDISILIEILYKSLLKIEYGFEFIKDIVNDSKQSWVNIEQKYFAEIKTLLKGYLKGNSEFIDEEGVIELNKCVDCIKLNLENYLISLCKIDLNNDIISKFEFLCSLSSNFNPSKDNIMVLNFNYTSTIESYKELFPQLKIDVNYIHGKLEDKSNPIIFGYGDETDQDFIKIEGLNNNECMRHLKSFAYLKTNNYSRLFKFLDAAPFSVDIMGHSCGLSDRLLFKHILEHDKFHNVQLFYHQINEQKNDFFEKTQNLSRYFDIDSKHKMRVKVKPFSSSQSLVLYTPTN